METDLRSDSSSCFPSAFSRLLHVFPVASSSSHLLSLGLLLKLESLLKCANCFGLSATLDFKKPQQNIVDCWFDLLIHTELKSNFDVLMLSIFCILSAFSYFNFTTTESKILHFFF